MSISSRKRIFLQDDEQFSQIYEQKRPEESTADLRETEVVKTKANLMTKFESETPN
jgi:hypothetical protein